MRFLVLLSRSRDSEKTGRVFPISNENHVCLRFLAGRQLLPWLFFGRSECGPCVRSVSSYLGTLCLGEGRIVCFCLFCYYFYSSFSTAELKNSQSHFSAESSIAIHSFYHAFSQHDPCPCFLPMLCASSHLGYRGTCIKLSFFRPCLGSPVPVQLSTTQIPLSRLVPISNPIDPPPSAEMLLPTHHPAFRTAISL